jgi:hypothetical protein
VVARSIDGRELLLGEAKWRDGECGAEDVDAVAEDLLRKGVPPGLTAARITRVVFLPAVATAIKRRKGRARLVDADDVVRALC